jgi:CSLREA domain-containing protein
VQKTFTPQSLFTICLILCSVLTIIAEPVGRGQAQKLAADPPTFVVNSLLDKPDENPGDGVCKAEGPGQACTLRAAIMEANHTPGGGASISLPGGQFTLTIPPELKDVETTGSLNITAGMSLNGAGPEASIIDAAGLDTALVVEAQGVIVTGVTLTNGMTPGKGAGGGLVNRGGMALNNCQVAGNGAGDAGGGIANQGSLTVTGCNVQSNQAQHGGGIHNSGSLQMTNSEVTNNQASVQGGGVFNTGVLNATHILVEGNGSAGQAGGVYSAGAGSSLALINSTVRSNQAVNGEGGGVFAGGTALLQGSTIDANTAAFGGGVFVDNGGQTRLVNSTLGGNMANRAGGGLFNQTGGTAQLYSVTIAENQSDADLNGSGLGGGVFNTAGSLVEFRNTLIGRNFETLLSGGRYRSVPGDCSGELTAIGVNLLDSYDSSRCTFKGAVTFLIVTDPMTGELAENGGPTQTYALLPGSLAINQGSAAGCTGPDGRPLNQDQRGAYRPFPYGGRCDIGAYEGSGSLTFLPLMKR